MRLDSPLAGLDSVTPDDLEQVPLIISGRERVQRELANWFGDRWERLQIAASFNLILNAANMVRYGVGTALSFDLNFSFDDLRFTAFSHDGHRNRPGLEEGSGTDTGGGGLPSAHKKCSIGIFQKRK